MFFFASPVVLDIERMLTNMFAGHNLRGIKNSANKDFKDWLHGNGKHIYIDGEKAAISMTVEIGNRFYTLTKNSSVIVLHYDNMILFLKTFHRLEQNALIQFMEGQRNNFILQMGTLSILFRTLIIPFWQKMSKNQIKKDYVANIEKFFVSATSIIGASNPIIKLLELGNVNTENNLYKMVGDKIHKIIEDDHRLEESKILVKNAISACLDYLKKITKSKDLTSSIDNDLILSTNTVVERIFGSMKALEPTKFNLNNELFSALNCCKFNHCLETLSARPDWETILKNAIRDTKQNVEMILRAENIRQKKKKEKLIEIEKIKDDEQRDLDRETHIFFLNPDLVPKTRNDLSDANFKKWKLLPRHYESGKDGRSVNKNLYQKSLISYLYKGAVQSKFYCLLSYQMISPLLI